MFPITPSPLAAFVSLDDAGRVVAWNPAAEELLGWQRHEILYRDAAEVIVPRDHVAQFDAAMDRLREGEGPNGHTRAVLRARDGLDRIVDLTIATIEVDRRPHVVLWAGDTSDRDEPASAPEILREARREDAAMAVVAHDGTVVEADDAAAALLRRDRARLQGDDARKLVHPADLAPVLSAARRVETGASRTAALEARVLLPGGGVAWGRMTFSPIPGPGPRALIVSFEDTTRERRAERQLAATAQELGAELHHDPVTGLLRAEPFAAALDAELATGAPLAVVAVALDLPTVPVRRRPAELELLLARVAGPFAGHWLTGEPVGRIGAMRLAAAYRVREAGTSHSVAAHVEDVLCAVDPRATITAIAVRPKPGDDAASLLLHAAAGLDAGADMAPPPLVPPRVEQLLDDAREHLGVEATLLARIEGARMRLQAVSGAGARFGLEPGTVANVDDAYCGLMLAGSTGHIVDTVAEPLTRELAPTAAGIQTYAGVPVHLPDGRFYGTLCAVDGSRRAPHMDARDVALLRFVARVVGEALVA